MASRTDLSTARSGVKLLSGLFKVADKEGYVNNRVGPSDLKQMLDWYGDGASLDDALERVHKYACAKYDTSSPSLTQMNRALGDAMKAIANGDKDGSDDISDSERNALATTWKAVLDFSADYEGSTVRDILEPSAAP